MERLVRRRREPGARAGRGKRRRRHTLTSPGGGGRRGESVPREPEFPFYALPPSDLPVTFRLKKK